MAKAHTFAMDLTPDGRSSAILMDGEDITGFLKGVSVQSDVNGGTFVELYPAKGCRAELMIRLPEARITIAEEH